MLAATYKTTTPASYNKLPGVVESDEVVRREGRLEKFLGEIGPLFVKADIAPFIGVGLLHKHNLVEDGYLMAQWEGSYENEEALVCCHTDVSALQQQLSPILYCIYAEAELIGLEFSFDPLVTDAHLRLIERPAFIRSFSSALNEYELQDHLGLSVTTRMFYRDREQDLVPVEQSDPQKIANVIRLRRECDIDRASMIQTSWSFTEAQDSQCIPLCSSVCVMRSPGHAREHYPNHGLIG